MDPTHPQDGSKLMRDLFILLTAILLIAPDSTEAQGLTDVTTSIRDGGGWVAMAIEGGEGSYSSVRLPTLNLKLNGCVTVWDKLSGSWEIEATETVTGNEANIVFVAFASADAGNELAVSDDRARYIEVTQARIGYCGFPHLSSSACIHGYDTGVSRSCVNHVAIDGDVLLNSSPNTCAGISWESSIIRSPRPIDSQRDTRSILPNQITCGTI